MALSVASPLNSFVRFDEDDIVDHPIFDNIRHCFPVVEEDDVAFQFFIRGTAEEINAFAGAYGTQVVFQLVDSADPEGDGLIEFSERPDVFRLSDTELLVNWSHGFPGFEGSVNIGQCFMIRLAIGTDFFYSGCFQRIDSTEFTSVLEYGNDENAFGFNYCNGGSSSAEVIEEGDACEPYLITFTNRSTLTIPYTAALRDLYGDVPDVRVWVYIDGVLTNPGLVINLDGNPVTMIDIDFGGSSSGVVIIK